MQVKFPRLLHTARLLAPHYLEKQRTFHITFIIKKNRIVSIGTNDHKKSHPRNLSYLKYNEHKIYIHSELSAIIKYGKEDCSDCTFVNIRIDRNNKLNAARPCRGCLDVLYRVGFDKLYFTTKEEIFEELP